MLLRHEPMSKSFLRKPQARMEFSCHFVSFMVKQFPAI
jgi:hypothetical protein